MEDKRNISFIESLDTVKQNHHSVNTFPAGEINRVSQIFKLSSLFSHSLILTDTQFVDNVGIRELFLQDEGFKEFIKESTFVGMRKDFSNFTDLVNTQLSSKMLFSSLDDSTNRIIKESSEGLNIHKLPPNYSLKKFGKFIEDLDNIFLDPAKKIEIDYRSNYAYPERLKNSLEKRINTLEPNGARRICNDLLDKLCSNEGKSISRSALYSFLEGYKNTYSSDDIEIVRRFFVDSEYNKNFWYTDDNKFNCMLHSNEEDENLWKKAFYKEDKYYTGETFEFKKIEFPCEDFLYLNQIDFNSLSDFRRKYKNYMKAKLSRIQKAKDNEEAQEKFTDYLLFLSNHISENSEEKGLKNLIAKHSIKIGVLAFLSECAIPMFAGSTSSIPITPDISISIGDLATSGCIVMGAANLIKDVYPKIKQKSISHDFEVLMQNTKIY